MAFKIKDFTSISASMINWMRGVTGRVSDYNVGSVVRTIVEAVAAELDQLYQQMFIGIKEAIPVSTYNTFNFDLLAAVNASGAIRVTITPQASNTVIPAGTSFSATGLASTYTSSQDTTISAGASYVDVQVAADIEGTAGNITSGQSFTPSPSPAGFISATNPASFSNGVSEETEDERKLRFISYIESLARSTVAGLAYGASTAALTDSLGNVTEKVATTSVVEPYLSDITQPIAKVEIYVHNGTGSTSSALITQAQKIIDGYYDDNNLAVAGYKAAGIPTTVYAATEVVQNVSGTLTLLGGYDSATMTDAAEQVIYAYLLGLGIGESAVLSEMIRLVKDLDGIYDVVITTPSANVTATAKQKILPGAITFS